MSHSRAYFVQHRRPRAILANPALVNDVLRSAGNASDTSARLTMHAHFDQDFGQVRVHTDDNAAISARALGARAYTVGRNVIFGRGEYAPGTKEGQRLLAHEFKHVVQQSRAGAGSDVEGRTKIAAQQVVSGRQISTDTIGSAPHSIFAQEFEERWLEPTSTRPAFRLGWGALGRLGQLALTPPSLQVPPLSPPALDLANPGTAAPSAATTPPALASQTGDELELPSRLPVVNSGRFSLGLRLGFPEAEARTLPGAPESALVASLQWATYRQGGRRSTRVNWPVPFGASFRPTLRRIWRVASAAV